MENHPIIATYQSYYHRKWLYSKSYTTHDARLFSYRNERMNRATPRKTIQTVKRLSFSPAQIFSSPADIPLIELAVKLISESSMKHKNGLSSIIRLASVSVGYHFQTDLIQRVLQFDFVKALTYRTICDDPCEIWLRPRPRQATRQPQPALPLNLQRHLHQAGMTTISVFILYNSLHWTESDETYLFCGNDGNVIKKLGAIRTLEETNFAHVNIFIRWEKMRK